MSEGMIPLGERLFLAGDERELVHVVQPAGEKGPHPAFRAPSRQPSRLFRRLRRGGVLADVAVDESPQVTPEDSRLAYPAGAVEPPALGEHDVMPARGVAKTGPLPDGQAHQQQAGKIPTDLIHHQLKRLLLGGICHPHTERHCIELY